MIQIEELSLSDLPDFWQLHLAYLIDDGIICDEEDRVYFSGSEYRGIIERNMTRDKDRHHIAYFFRDGKRIGAVSYCIYQSEGGKCFILDYWVFPRFRGGGTGHRCFEALERYTRSQGARYCELNAAKEDAIRFWKSLGFVEAGIDEDGLPLFIRH